MKDHLTHETLAEISANLKEAFKAETPQTITLHGFPVRFDASIPRDEFRLVVDGKIYRVTNIGVLDHEPLNPGD